MSYESITKRTASLQKVQSWFYDPSASFPNPGRRIRIFVGAIGIVRATIVNFEMSSWAMLLESIMLSCFMYFLPRTTLTYDEYVAWGFVFWEITIGQLIAVHILPRRRWAPEEKLEALMTVLDLPLHASDSRKTLRSIWHRVTTSLFALLSCISLLIQELGLPERIWARTFGGDVILELIYALWFTSSCLRIMKQPLPNPLADWC